MLKLTMNRKGGKKRQNHKEGVRSEGKKKQTHMKKNAK
jgi:hypothetical protein